MAAGRGLIDSQAVSSLVLSKLTGALLQAALDLDVFTKLGDRAVPLTDLAGVWGMPAPSARLLAQFLCNMGLLRYEQNSLSITPLAQQHLLAYPQSLIAKALLGDDLNAKTLADKLQNPAPQVWYTVQEGPPSPNFVSEHLASLRGGEQDVRILMGEQVAEQYDFSAHKVLMDIGGMAGAWCIAIRRRYPHLQCLVYDLPFNCQIAETILAEAGQSDYIKPVPGNFFTEELPTGADVMLLANVLHDWTPERDRIILGKVHRALPKNGILLVKEFFFEDDWSGPVGWGAHQAYMVLGSEGATGWQPSYGEMEALLQECGFELVGRGADLIIAKKPGL